MLRDARMDDIDGIMKLGGEVIAKSDLSDMPIEPNVCRRNLAMMIASKKFFSVVDADQELNGFMFGTVEAFYWTIVKYGTDISLVSKGGRAGNMVKLFEKWAANQGAVKLIMGVVTGLNIERTGDFYETLGFKKAGGIYEKELR